MAGLGPFEVGAEQVERAGVGFTRLVNQVLALEALRAGMRSHQLRVDSQDESPDGGVDAQLFCDRGTVRIPAGESVWQFKRGDLPPAKCREELRGARWAREAIVGGAAYRLVLGARLTPQKVSRRRDALIAEAKVLGIEVRPDQFEVLDANSLAEWASDFPALAVSQLLGGPGYGANDFDLWSRSNRHQTRWATSEAREAELSQIRSDLDDGGRVDIRVQGVSGLGKTRLVMEALRGTRWEPLVAYVPQVDDLSPDFMNHAMNPNRAVLLVVDECDSRRHEKLAERIPTDAVVRLITIGQDATFALRSPVISPEPLAHSSLEDFLQKNYSALGSEGHHFIVRHAGGNVRWAMILAERIETADFAQAAELIRSDDMALFTSELLPEGRDFFLASMFALFERIGWDLELRPELELLASFADVPMEDLEALADRLEARGFLERKGRYRSIGPHPLAVVLAADAWNRMSDEIVAVLLPMLPRPMTMSLLSRAADLGTYSPARGALGDLLAPGGPFGSLEAIESQGLGAFLTKLAIVLPDEATEHLGALIQSESTETLRSQTNSRRDLVWTLEKLVWHSRTFERAADALLRLSLAENETYGNNATGVWSSLFGTVLPATAATPVQRANYLLQVEAAADASTQERLIDAIEGSLHPHENVMVSGELQGGALVERRGGAQDADAAWAYRKALVEILGRLREHGGKDVRSRAVGVLLGTVGGLIAVPIVGPALAAILASFEDDELVLLRRQIEKIRGRREGESTSAAALDALVESLPAARPIDRIRVLVDLGPWDFRYEQRSEELVEQLNQLDRAEVGDEVLRWLSEREVPSSWHLGRGLASLPYRETLEPALVRAADLNLPALAGFLTGIDEDGAGGAFDEFFASDLASELDDQSVLSLTIRGPASGAAKARAKTCLPRMSVVDGSTRLFGWHTDLDEADAVEILDGWLGRINDQLDYNAVVDWIALWAHDRKPLSQELAERVVGLVLMRGKYPDLAHQAWDWAQLANAVPASASVHLAQLLIDLVEQGALIHESSEDAQLLGALAESDPVGVWKLLTRSIGDGGWRLGMSIRGWITTHFPIDVLSDWVGDDLDRARILAQVATAGADTPSPETEFLLKNFGDDEEIRSSLAGDFMSGSWMGAWSDRIRKQISDLESWQTPDRPDGIRRWAREVTVQLRRDLDDALQREAEETF